MEDFLTSDEVLVELRISRRTLDRLLASGQLAAQRIGETGTLRFKRGDVAAVLQPRTTLAGAMARGSLPDRGMMKHG
jgi:excisionase family DNA binding protein